VRGGKRHSRVVWLRYIDEDLSTYRPDQCRKHRFGREAVVCEQWADFATRTARPNYTPSGQMSVADQSAPGMTRRREPTAQERTSRCRKYRSVVGRDQSNGTSVNGTVVGAVSKPSTQPP
jgi:hypothetical protein